MKIYNETSLTSDLFWSGAIDNFNSLTSEEVEEVETLLEDCYPEGIDATQLNDIFWFDFDWICEAIGKKIEED